MKPIDIIIIVLAALIVVGVIALSLWRKKTGKTGCGCGCHGCCGCVNGESCPSKRAADEENE